MPRTSNRGGRRAKPLPHPPGALTRNRLLDAAEHLFAEKGFSGVSLREIVRKATVNVAAAHYHFGSKESLFEEVFSRAAQPVKEQTFDMLARAEMAKGQPDYLEQIIRALIVPGFLAGSDSGRGNRNYGKLRAYLFLEDRRFANKVFKRFYAEITQRSIEVIRSALPDLKTREIAWRFHVLLGTLVFTTVPAGRVHPFTSQSYRPENADEAIAFLVPLLVAVFRAPCVDTAPKSHTGSPGGQRSMREKSTARFASSSN